MFKRRDSKVTALSVALILLTTAGFASEPSIDSARTEIHVRLDSFKQIYADWSERLPQLISHLEGGGDPVALGRPFLYLEPDEAIEVCNMVQAVRRRNLLYVEACLAEIARISTEAYALNLFETKAKVVINYLENRFVNGTIEILDLLTQEWKDVLKAPAVKYDHFATLMNMESDMPCLISAWVLKSLYTVVKDRLSPETTTFLQYVTPIRNFLADKQQENPTPDSLGKYFLLYKYYQEQSQHCVVHQRLRRKIAKRQQKVGTGRTPVQSIVPKSEAESGADVSKRKKKKSEAEKRRVVAAVVPTAVDSLPSRVAAAAITVPSSDEDDPPLEDLRNFLAKKTKRR